MRKFFQYITRTFELTLYISLGLLLFAGIAYAIYYLAKKRLEAKVHRKSERYNGILAINEIYCFSNETNKVFTHSCKRKDQFDGFDAEDYVIGILENDYDWLKIMFEAANGNALLEEEYRKDIEKALDNPQMGHNGLLGKLIRKVETKECESAIIKPQKTVTVSVYNCYTSPKGQNSYENEDVFCGDELWAMYAIAEHQRKFKESAKYQRSLMSDSLRYKILQRDKSTCQLCGATRADGAKLEVDHIIPISKGGKTEPGNLRTLCRECNRGKGDKYEEGMFN